MLWVFYTQKKKHLLIARIIFNPLQFIPLNIGFCKARRLTVFDKIEENVCPPAHNAQCILRNIKKEWFLYTPTGQVLKIVLIFRKVIVNRYYNNELGNIFTLEFYVNF